MGPPLAGGAGRKGLCSQCKAIQDSGTAKHGNQKMHIARRLEEFGQSGFLADLGLFSSAQEWRTRMGFSGTLSWLSGLAPHPGLSLGPGLPQNQAVLSSPMNRPPLLPFLFSSGLQTRSGGLGSGQQAASFWLRTLPCSRHISPLPPGPE